jgi:chromate reductase
MSKTYNVAVVVGSLRKDSMNRKMAQALAKLAPESLKLTIVEKRQVADFHYRQ